MKSNSKLIGLFTVLLFVVALPIALIALRQTTENRQHASQFRDFNTSGSITQTTNADGTMGPPDSTGNLANSLDASLRGSATFLITDPSQTGKPAWAAGYGYPVNSINTLPSGGVTTVPSMPLPEGPLSVNSLTLTIWKGEVHLGQLQASASAQPGNPSSDIWETVNMGNPKTIDLVQLSKGNIASLGLTALGAGLYTEVRLYIKDATAVLSDGTKVSLALPGRNNIVRVNQPFTVTAGGNTNLTLDFDAQNSVMKAGNEYMLKLVVANFVESKNNSVSAPSAVVSPPQGCYYQHRFCPLKILCNGGNCTCGSILICPGGSPIPHPTCIPEPWCLNHAPFCRLMQPKNGFCPPSVTPILSPSMPPQPSCGPTPYCNPRLGILCRAPEPCNTTISPVPTVTCFPRPSCLDATPACQLPEPTQGWCPPQQINLSPLQVDNVLTYLNTILRNLFVAQKK